MKGTNYRNYKQIRLFMPYYSENKAEKLLLPKISETVNFI